MMMEVICSSEMPVLTRATWHNIPEDSILQTYSDYSRSEKCFLLLCKYSRQFCIVYILVKSYPWEIEYTWKLKPRCHVQDIWGNMRRLFKCSTSSIQFLFTEHSILILSLFICNNWNLVFIFMGLF
jgi:hypothetical protein